MGAALWHKHEITSRFGEGFWVEIIDRMEATTFYPRERCETQLDNCLAYLLARAAMTDPNAALVCNLEPDLAWHTFLLYTAEYAEFCRDVAGVYLHHDPADESALVNTAEATAYTVALFVKHQIGFDLQMWRDHVRYPHGAIVTPTGLTERVPARV